LLNIKKISVVSVKVLPKGKLSKYLTNKTEFSRLLVYRLNSVSLGQIHVHLKPTTQQLTVKGET